MNRYSPITYAAFPTGCSKAVSINNFLINNFIKIVDCSMHMTTDN